jgi:hypothetical protein
MVLISSLIVTPDNKSIDIEIISIDEIKKYIESKEVQFLEYNNSNFRETPIYQASSGSIIYPIASNLYSIKFSAKNNYNQFIKGHFHYNAGLIYQKDKVYYIFDIYPDKARLLLETIGLEKELTVLYPNTVDSLKYHTYLLKNGSIGYFYDRPNNLKDGFWFPDINSFEYYFYDVFQNKRLS